MNRLEAIYRSWATPCGGQQVYSPCHRAAWMEKLREAGVRRRVEETYQQLDSLMGYGRKSGSCFVRDEPLREFKADTTCAAGDESYSSS